VNSIEVGGGKVRNDGGSDAKAAKSSKVVRKLRSDYEIRIGLEEA
jgi:hypothetical protein